MNHRSSAQPDIVAHFGYPVETHDVTTSDGYGLQLHRIPDSPKWQQRGAKRAVLLQHGLMDSSATWCLLGPGRALGEYHTNTLMGRSHGI